MIRTIPRLGPAVPGARQGEEIVKRGRGRPKKTPVGRAMNTSATTYAPIKNYRTQLCEPPRYYSKNGGQSIIIIIIICFYRSFHPSPLDGAMAEWF